MAYYQRAETRCDPMKRRPSAPSSDHVGRAAAVARDALVRLARSLTRGCPGGLDGPAAVAPVRTNNSSALKSLAFYMPEVHAGVL